MFLCVSVGGYAGHCLHVIVCAGVSASAYVCVCVWQGRLKLECEQSATKSNKREKDYLNSPKYDMLRAVTANIHQHPEKS